MRQQDAYQNASLRQHRRSRSSLSLVLLAGIVKRRRLTNFVHWVGVEVTPDVFVHVVAGVVFSCAAAGLDRTVSSTRIATDIEVGNQASRISIRWLDLINIDDWAKLMHPEQLPTSAVMIVHPAAIEHVRETEVSILRCCRRERLP